MASLEPVLQLESADRRKLDSGNASGATRCCAQLKSVLNKKDLPQLCGRISSRAT